MAKIEPNLRQRRTAEIMMENGGKMSPAMKIAGYSKAYSKNPDKLKKTKGWEELLEGIPNDKLIRVANEGLEANRVISAINKSKLAKGETASLIEVPDYPTRQRFLETALKMKGKLLEKSDITSEGQRIGGFVVIRTVKE